MKLISKFVFTVFIFVLKIISPFFSVTLDENEFIQSEDNPSTSENLLVTFFEMGDGDCILIKKGNIEILIDAGENVGKLESQVKPQLQSKITDGVLEYVFVTHGDSDHIGNMATVLSWFHPNGSDVFKTQDNKKYKILNLIDFENSENKNYYTSNAYNKYVKTRNDLSKKSLTYYPIDEFYNLNNRIELDGANNLFLNILYNKFYFEKSTKSNNLSICLEIEFGESKVLLTGDLEENGEQELLLFYSSEENNELLKNISLFKAGHHGSAGSNSKSFIDYIKPKYVMITCNAGGKNYNFPRQETLDNFLCYTDHIYISSYLISGEVMAPYHGKVTFSLDQFQNVKVECENKDNASDDYKLNLYKEIDGKKELNPITETKWFKENRKHFTNVYVFSGVDDDASDSNYYLGNCTLIKNGHYDILIDCGNDIRIGSNSLLSRNYVEKIKKYCVDGIIEYMIVTTPLDYSISQLIDNGDKKGLFSEFKIINLIDFGDSYDPSDGGKNSLFAKYKNTVKQLIKNGTNYFPAKDIAQENKIVDFGITEDLSIDILNHDYYEEKGKNKFESSVACSINFSNKKMIFASDINETCEHSLLKYNDFSNTVFFQATDFGFAGSNSKEFISELKSRDLFIAVNTILNFNIYGKKIMTKSVCDRLLNASNGNVYVTAMNTAKEGVINVNGDIIFTLYNDGTWIKDDSLVKLHNMDYYNNL